MSYTKRVPKVQIINNTNNMFTDYTTRKQRLSKKDYSADFRLADSDDFFGFKEEQGDLTLTQVILGVLIGLPALWFVLSVLFAMTPNI